MEVLEVSLRISAQALRPPPLRGKISFRYAGIQPKITRNTPKQKTIN